MNASSSSEMITGPDLFQYYIRGVSELLSGDGFLPSSLENSRFIGARNGSFKDKDVAKEENRSAVGFDSLFCNAVGDGLSDYEKTRLMTMLKQSVIALNREVNEMLDPVFAMLRLRALMAPTTKCAVTNQEENGKVEIENRSRKRLKVSSPFSPAIVEVSANKGLGVTEAGKSLPRCENKICVKAIPKSNHDESKSCRDCSKQVNSGSFLGSSSRDDKENGEVNDDLQVLLLNRGPVAEKMEKHSAELSAMLSRMEEKLEELLNIVISSCRKMTVAEKNHLRRLIEKLPPQNLERVVNIIQRGKPPEKQSDHNDITVNLQQEDDLTLWRLYFYVKAVESAQKLL